MLKTVDQPAKMPRAPVPANMNTVRGVACLLVIALHVVGDNPSTGLHLPMDSNWHYAMACIEFLRMPLFTALSGFLYAGRRVTRAEFPGFWAKKFRRLAVPLVFLTLVTWVLRQRVYPEQEPLPEALLFSYGHLWYIQSLILLFAAISVADILFRPSATVLMLTGLATIMISQSEITVTTFFSFAGFLYLAPYFMFGIILRERPDWLQDRRAGTIALGIVVIVLISQQFGLFGLTNGVTSLQLPAALAGMACVVVLLQRMPIIPWLAAIGTYSYTVYLWHIIASASTRSALMKLGVDSVPVLFAISYVAALIVPIILYHVARRIPLLSIAATGEHVFADGGPTSGRPRAWFRSRRVATSQ
jgi:peptidoglycan/LPS O-acetylase OafA/YrhL